MASMARSIRPCPPALWVFSAKLPEYLPPVLRAIASQGSLIFSGFGRGLTA
jgi:hypothetical protein